jgi:cell division protein DivIC
MALQIQPDSPASPFWNFAIKGLALLIFAGLVACFAIPFRTRLADYRELDSAARLLEEKETELKRTLERRTAELALLERDPGFVEIKARDHLDMCRPDEVIFRFEDAAP